jgi:hypothetical protein
MYTENSVVDRPNQWMPITGSYQKFESPTSNRFWLDCYWDQQIFSLLSPQISGAWSWDVQKPIADIDIHYMNIVGLTRYRYVAELKAPAAIGAILVDADSIFSNERHVVWNTNLAPSLSTRRGLRNLNYDFWAAGPIEAMPAPEHVLPKPELYKPQLPMVQIELETPHATLLKELHRDSPWNSWKKLETVLGEASHTQLQRVAAGTMPSPALATNIDDLHRFAQRLNKITRGNPTATLRVLATPRARDGKSANDFLAGQDYRNAFRAVMDAASPKPTIAAAESRPLRWFDEPSRDLYEDGAQPEE